MDKFIEKLKKQEKTTIIKVMAFMSYNPSIGRVMESGGVKKFQNMSLKYVAKLYNIKTIEDYDNFHRKWVLEIIKTIKTNKKELCSYGQAQKPINVFLKLYIDWANLPTKDISKKLLSFLHVPLDKILMKSIAKEYKEFYNNTIKPFQKNSFSLKQIDKNLYFKWQSFFRVKYPKKPLLFDIAWAMNREEN